MKLRMLAVTCVVLAISALGFTAAGASTHIDVRPYLGNIGIGTSVPGDPNSVLCLVLVDGSATYGGKVNGVVVPSRTGELNINIRAQDLVTVLPTCTATAISIDTVDATNIAIQATAPKTGGILQISTTAAVQPGINATATTSIRVHYSAGQVLKTPTGGTLTGGALSGGTFADFTLKPVATITKASLNLLACSDSQYLIDTNTPDGSKSNGPTATELDLVSPFSTTPKLGDAGVYVATIRGCAENTATTPGKPASTKIAITGAGNASVDFLSSSTDNPAVWDTTRGATCGAAKSGGTFGATALLESRVLICKGDYGAPIPLSLTVRNWIASGVGFKDSYGLIHPGPPVEILNHTFS